MSRGHFVSPATAYPWPAFGRIGHHRFTRSRTPAPRRRRLVGDHRVMLLRRELDLVPDSAFDAGRVVVINPVTGDRESHRWVDGDIVAADLAMARPGRPVRIIHAHGTVVELVARVVR